MFIQELAFLFYVLLKFLDINENLSARHFFVKFDNIEFNEYQCILAGVVSCVLTDGAILMGAPQGCEHA
jgi:hypothetical protein